MYAVNKLPELSSIFDSVNFCCTVQKVKAKPNIKCLLIAKKFMKLLCANEVTFIMPY